MSTAPATKADKQNALYKECGLVKEDVHKHQHYTILTRTGIEKVQAHYGIQVRYKALRLEPKYAVIKAVATMKDATVETYGSAVPENCKNPYYAEMAEKRALSRAVLKLTGLYAHGFFGEDESDDFGASVKKATADPQARLNAAMAELRTAEKVSTVWFKYPDLHDDELFSAAAKDRKKQLTPKAD